MTPEEKQQIDAVIEAGEKATQGRAFLNALLEVLTENDDITNCCRKPEDGLFIRDCFNTREALKAMRAYLERLEGVLEVISLGGSVKNEALSNEYGMEIFTWDAEYIAEQALSQTETDGEKP